MFDTSILKSEDSFTYEELLRVIHKVRNRWRLRLALRGAAIVIALGFIVFAMSAYGMDYFRYSEGAVVAFRVFAYLAIAALTVRFLVLLPLFRRVSEEQVALYIEEHEPSLQQALVSAVEAGAAESEELNPDHSPALIRKLVYQAVEKCETMDYGRRVEHRSLQKASGTMTAFAALGMVAVLLSPAFLRHAASLLLHPFQSAEAASPYIITVDPGDTGVARGADQLIHASLEGFDSDQVDITVKPSEEESWQRWPMAFDDGSGTYSFMLFDLQNPMDYYVEASGVRSDLFNIDVSDLPFVQTIDLTYHFPDYTGLAPRTVEDGGDIAAVRGTQVHLTLTPTVRVAGGRIRLEEAEPIPLELADDTTLTGVVMVTTDGFYKIELEAFDGTLHDASADYIIEVLTDQPPSVTISKPGRDSKVNSIEEVFTEVKAEDDFGIAKLELVYSVNGGGDEIVPLLTTGSLKKEFTAGHTFFLEDWELVPGDFISYFARVSDTDHISGPQTASTDIYFIEVRPFGKEYRQAQQGGMQGGGAGADGALSLRQRQIVAATFKLIRDKEKYSADDYAENLTTLALMQGRLREQVANLLRRMGNRGISQPDSDFGKIGDSLQQAIAEMEPAEEQLMAGQPTEALPLEQRALQHLQRAEAVFREVQVAFGGGGGGGGGEQSNAEDLADLFELEMDKLKNQYETVARGERQSMDNQVDEALQRLQELARRQLQENERMKRLVNTPNQSGRGGANQRELAEEAEELARRLERLAREESLPDLNETARRLRQAADSMRRGASSGASGSLSEGIAALDELKDARRLLEKNRSVRLERDVDDALSRAQRLAGQQEKIQSEVEKLGQGDAGELDRIQRMLERKDEMASEVADLESQIDRMARESRSEQKDASRKLQGAANSIRDNKLKEKIRYSKGVVQGRSPEYAQKFEEQVGSDIDELVDRLGEAAGAVGKSQEAEVAGALEKTRDLVRNLESLGERVRERQEQQARGLRKDGQGRQQQEGSSEERGQGQQGGEGSQSGEGKGGREGQAGDEYGTGGSYGAGSREGSNFQPGTFSSEEIRQLRREFRERGLEADDLRRELARQDLQVPDLQSIIERMKAFDEKQIYLDPLGFDELQGSLLEELKQFEYWLRRELEGLGNEKLFLTGSDQVPSEFRKLVEEYYRSLSNEPGGGGSN
jgi:hypothetical protein